MAAYGPLVVSKVELMTVSIPMKIKVSHNLAERQEARNVLLRVHEPGGEHGWGESCPREYVTGESITSVLHCLGSQFVPGFLHKSFDSFEAVVQALSAIGQEIQRNEQAAFCALELALLDLASRYFQVPVAEALGPVARTEFTYSAVIAAGDIVTARALAERYTQFGMRTFKVKTAADLDLNRALLAEVRHVIGADASMRIDANEAWDAPEAVRQLSALQEFNLTGVEQPVPAADLEGMVHVVAAGLTPVVADESLCSYADGKDLVARKGADIFNIRVSKCGGLINSMRIATLVWEAGLKCQLGAQVGETGILSAAGRQFAASARSLTWLEGSFDALLLDRIITRPDMTFSHGGHASAVSGFGLGVEVIGEELKAVQTSHQAFV